MPLRKPGDLPPMPKTRKKSLDKVKSAVPEKKRIETEYKAYTYFSYDPIKKKQFYVIALSTVKEFSVLNYELSLDVLRVKSNIEISILGLSATASYLVQPKGATKDLLFDDLYGTFTISVIKQDGSINSFQVEYNIYKKTISILKQTVPRKKNNTKFCTFEVLEHLHTFIPTHA
ncbi:MAG: hypothetical protein HYV28_12640 [Ignavibacteriales bacterium]|nr:hypothetical protein [Ignavibacteriales bacterium]